MQDQGYLAVGDRVRVRPSGETGRIRQVVRAADGRDTYDIEFDGAAGSTRRADAESGGLCVAEDVEPVA